MKKAALFTMFLLGFFSVQAHAVSYFLDQSDVLPDNVNYLQVTIEESLTTDGGIDFTVSIINSDDAFGSFFGGNNYGIKTFKFNYDVIKFADVNFELTNFTGLSSNWSLKQDKVASVYGQFELDLSSAPPSGLTTLTFTIVGIENDLPEDYAVSSLFVDGAEMTAFFAAHVIDFSNPDNPSTSAWFAGSTEYDPRPSVPLPAAVWLFGSGLIGFAGFRRIKGKKGSSK